MAIHGGPAGAEAGLADTNREVQLETRSLGITVVFGQKCMFGTKSLNFLDYSEALLSRSSTTR